MNQTSAPWKLRALFSAKRSQARDLLPAAVTHDGVVLVQHVREGRSSVAYR